MKLQTFNHPDFGSVEAIDLEGKQWFGATKAAVALGYVNPQKAVRDHCRDEGCTIRSVLTDGGQQEMKFIDEGNLYRLIVKSRLPLAEKYERWVFDEVLPSIRKHGAYMTSETIERTLTDPDFIIKLATELKTERLEKQALQTKIEADRPKVVFAESLEVSNDTILIGQLAKILKQNGIDLGQNRLFQILREEGYLMKIGERRNQPTQRSMDLQLMQVKVGTRSSSSEGTKNTYTTKVTGKGIMYFINKFKNQSQSA